MSIRVVEEHFGSIHELLRVIGARPHNSEMARCNSSEENDKSFTGTKNWDEAVQLFRTGYTDVLPQIKSGIEKNVKATGVQNRRFVRTGVVGYAPHVPNAINGLPNSMIYTETQPQKIKAVTIYYAPTENCGTETTEFIKSGICALSAINILELSGVRVNLDVVMFNGTNFEDTEGTFATVKVKDFRDQMDVQKLCFPVVHPSLFRRFGFKWLETSPGIKEEGWAYSYGHHSQKYNKIIRQNMRDNEYFITLADTNQVEYSPEKLIEQMGIKK